MKLLTKKLIKKLSNHIQDCRAKKHSRYHLVGILFSWEMFTCPVVMS